MRQRLQAGARLCDLQARIEWLPFCIVIRRIAILPDEAPVGRREATMNRFHTRAVILAFLGLAGFMIPAASADIYSWTDENGVRHFTNQAPPEHRV